MRRDDEYIHLREKSGQASILDVIHDGNRVCEPVVFNLPAQRLPAALPDQNCRDLCSLLAAKYDCAKQQINVLSWIVETTYETDHR